MIWRMAWRNLWRHRTRTLIMATAVGFTYGIMLMSLGIGDDAHRRMLEEATKAAGGDVIVHGDGYWDTRSSDVIIPQGQDVMDRIAAVNGVEHAMPRVIIQGLASTSSGTRPVFLSGVDAAAEAALTDPARDIVAGTFLSGGEHDPLVLGRRMVDKLDLEIGDRVVLTTSQPGGEVTRGLFHLTGVIETGVRELDEVIGYTTIAAAQSTLGVDGMLTQIGVLASDRSDAVHLAGAIRTALDGARSLEVLPWPEAVPEMVGFVEIDDRIGYVYLAVMLVVVLFSITNTFLMAVMERVRELGLLSALGLRGRRITSLLLTETVLLTLIAVGFGFVLGFSVHLLVAKHGISLALWGIEELDVAGIDFSDMVMYSTVNPVKWFVATVFVIGATVSSAVYPALRAARLAPAEAMRFYE